MGFDWIEKIAGLKNRLQGKVRIFGDPQDQSLENSSNLHKVISNDRL